MKIEGILGLHGPKGSVISYACIVKMQKSRHSTQIWVLSADQKSIGHISRLVTSFGEMLIVGHDNKGLSFAIPQFNE